MSSTYPPAPPTYVRVLPPPPPGAVPNVAAYRNLPATNYAGQGTEAVLNAAEFAQGVALTVAGVRAAQRFHEIHDDWPAAVAHGARAMRRWLVWSWFVIGWGVSAMVTLWLLYLRFHTIRGEGYPVDATLDRVTRNCLIFLLPALVLGVLVPFVRNVDFSMGPRRPIYRMISPLARTLTWAPNWLLYLTVPMVLCFPF